MAPNVYDTNPKFFKKYAALPRSKEGLEGTDEWKELQSMFPDFKGKRVLDLGCGYGWLCKYAVENGALSAIGVDGSHNMIEQARMINGNESITFQVNRMEDIYYPDNHFDIVVSSLAFHYLASFDPMVELIKKYLVSGGDLVFMVPCPIMTAVGTLKWHYNSKGKAMHWPVDRYFEESVRNTTLLDEKVQMYHRTYSTYITTLIKHGFQIADVKEPISGAEFEVGNYKSNTRRPHFLAIAAKK